MKKYVVTLTAAGRAELVALVRGGASKARRLTRAVVLLAAADGQADAAIARTVRVHPATVERLRRRFVEEGRAAALAERPRPGAPPKLDGHQQASLLALACGAPPAAGSAGRCSGSPTGRWRAGWSRASATRRSGRR